MLTKKDTNVATAEAIRLEARDRVRSLAAPVAPGENIKALWRKVSRKTGFSARRVRSLWYDQANTIHAHELDVLRQMTGAEKAVEQAQGANRDLQAEIAGIRQELAQLMEKLGKIQNDYA